jgi:hypothetical protein
VENDAPEDRQGSLEAISGTRTLESAKRKLCAITEVTVAHARFIRRNAKSDVKVTKIEKFAGS